MPKSTGQQRTRPILKLNAKDDKIVQVDLNDGAKTSNIDKTRQSWPKVYFSTEFDIIARDDEE